MSHNARFTLNVGDAQQYSWKQIVLSVATAIGAVADAIYKLGDPKDPGA